MIRAVLLVALVGCESFDVFVNATTDDGTVYECAAADGGSIEVCYHDDSTEELGALLGRTCDQPSRRWPWFVNKLNAGCTYACPSPKFGCNAHQGCYCPSAPE